MCHGRHIYSYVTTYWNYYNYVLTEIICALHRCRNAEVPTQTKYNDFMLSNLASNAALGPHFRPLVHEHNKAMANLIAQTAMQQTSLLFMMLQH